MIISNHSREIDKANKICSEKVKNKNACKNVCFKKAVRCTSTCFRFRCQLRIRGEKNVRTRNKRSFHQINIIIVTGFVKDSLRFVRFKRKSSFIFVSPKWLASYIKIPSLPFQADCLKVILPLRFIRHLSPIQSTRALLRILRCHWHKLWTDCSQVLHNNNMMNRILSKLRCKCHRRKRSYADFRGI